MQIKSIKISGAVFLFAACIAIAGIACKKGNSNAAPVIDQVHLLDSTARDSFFVEALAGTYIVVQGQHFNGLEHVYFNDMEASFNSALNSDHNIIILIPADAPTEATDPNVPNTLRVVTSHGEATYSFSVVPPPPAISALSNEMALGGETIAIAGSSFYFLDSIVFPGHLPVTSFTVNAAANRILLTVPSGITESGPLSIYGKFGSSTSVLLFNDSTTGVICNFDNVSNFSWGCDVKSDAGTFPGARGSYAEMTFSNIPANEGSWWNGGRSLNTNSGQWIPSGHASDPIDNYALKFEIYVKQPWVTGSFYIVKDYDWTYLAIYAPWKAQANYTTSGWQTVTIPLSSFKTNTGAGSPPASLEALVGGGSGSIDIMFVNNTDTGVDSFDAAVDNLRIVRVQ